MSVMVSQITCLMIVYSTVYSCSDQRKLQNSVSLAFVGWNSPVTGEFPVQRASNAENVSIWWRHHDMVNVSSANILLPVWHPRLKLKSVLIKIQENNPLFSVCLSRCTLNQLKSLINRRSRTSLPSLRLTTRDWYPGLQGRYVNKELQTNFIIVSPHLHILNIKFTRKHFII